MQTPSIKNNNNNKKNHLQFILLPSNANAAQVESLPLHVKTNTAKDIFSLLSFPPLPPTTPTNPSVPSLQDHPEGFLNSQYQMSCKDEYKNNTS